MNGVGGLTRRINASQAQLAKLQQLHRSGQVVSGVTKLRHGKGVRYDDGEIFIPPGFEVASNIVEGKGQGLFSRRRNLASTLGAKPILAVR